MATSIEATNLWKPNRNPDRAGQAMDTACSWLKESRTVWEDKLRADFWGW